MLIILKTMSLLSRYCSKLVDLISCNFLSIWICECLALNQCAVRIRDPCIFDPESLDPGSVNFHGSYGFLDPNLDPKIWIHVPGSTTILYEYKMKLSLCCKLVTSYCIDSPLLPPLLPLPIETNIMRLLKPSIQVEGSSPAHNKTFPIKNLREGVWDLKLELNHVTCHHHQNITLKKKELFNH